MITHKVTLTPGGRKLAGCVFETKQDEELQVERWKEVSEAVKDFRQLLSDDVPVFELTHANDRTWSQEQYLQYRRDTEYRKKFGVYLHFDEEERLLYIGMATSTFDRFWNSRGDDVRYTDIIALEPPYDVLIPSLELFLIRRLNPPHNTAGKVHIE